jgi:hypothetical protein
VRDLDALDFGVLLSVFAVLLIFFGIDFRVSRAAVRRHQRRAMVFAGLSLLGEVATAFALVMTWVALFLPPEAERIDTMLVFVPGSLAVACAVILTVQSALARLTGLGAGDPDT